MTKTRTSSYRFTVQAKDRDTDQRLIDLRAQIAIDNKVTSREGLETHYIKLQGRLGRDNPNANDPRLRRRGSYAGAQIIPADIAERFDVYVYARDPGSRRWEADQRARREREETMRQIRMNGAVASIKPVLAMICRDGKAQGYSYHEITNAIEIAWSELA